MESWTTSKSWAFNLLKSAGVGEWDGFVEFWFMFLDDLAVGHNTDPVTKDPSGFLQGSRLLFKV